MPRLRIDITESERLKAIKEAWGLRSYAATIDFILANYSDRIIADAEKIGDGNDQTKKLISSTIYYPPDAQPILKPLVA